MENEKPTPQQTETPNNPPSAPPLEIEEPKSKKKIYIVLGAVLILIAAMVGAILLFGDKDKPASQTPTATPPPTQQPEQSNRTLCVPLGVSSLQCEDLKTAERRKYDIPESMGRINDVISNSDGSKFIATTYQQTDNGALEATKVYDRQFKEIATLAPAKISDNASDIQYQSWVNDNTIVYLKPTGGDKKPLYSFDVTKNKESLLMETDKSIEGIMPTTDVRHIYGLQALTNQAANRVERRLVVIDTQSKTLTPVANNNVVDVNTQSLAFNNQTSLFYANTLISSEQRMNLRTYKVEEPTSKPTLTFVEQIDNVRYDLVYAGRVSIPEQGGFLAQSGKDLDARVPLKIYTSDGKFKELGLGVGASSAFYLQLNGFPQLSKLASAEPETRDFFKPAKDTPPAITTFIDTLITARKDCKPGEYRTFILTGNDGEKQFGVSQTGCAGYGVAIYNQNGSTYKFLTSFKEGLSCEDRDMFGISTKVESYCRKPGEGL